MADRRHKDSRWLLPPLNPDRTCDSSTVTNALLMDLRDELKKLNALLHCGNAVAIPEILRAIRRNTAKPRKKVAKKVRRR